ncbi:MAG: hypothetical protein HYZ28_00535 [Myxococcales bacterium]|nr:hypothetical protein [Myxococcales bacterium]
MVAGAAIGSLSCARTPAFPWAAQASGAPPAHAEVETLSGGYDRRASRVLVRRVRRATRANLDFAAHHANVILAQPGPEEAPAARLVDSPFGGAVVTSTLVGSVRQTPLSAEELASPLAFSPLVDYLARVDPRAAQGLEEARNAVRAESWGGPPNPQWTFQEIAELYLHRETDSRVVPWVRIEFQPWARVFRQMPDLDGDGFAELWGALRPELLPPALLARVEGDYRGRALDGPALAAWANELASYWYPSYNTDLYRPAGGRFPGTDTEPEVAREMGGATVEHPSVVLRGKPQGVPVYLVLVVDGAEPAAAPQPVAQAVPIAKAVSPKVEPLVAALGEELSAHGGSFEAWAEELRPTHDAIRRLLKERPEGLKAIPGREGYLFYRASLAYLAGGDLTAQRQGKNPLPVIAAFKEALAREGVDFLFVPVPTKAEIFPELLPRLQLPRAAGVLNPWQRKLLLELARRGVESVDLLPLFRAARAQDSSEKEPLYQPLDTHWTDRGLRLAAGRLSERVKAYPWFEAIAGRRAYQTKEVRFRRQGDLVSRLAPGEQGRYPPQELLARQVVGPGGSLYEDDPESPIVVLGDSFTAVYQRLDCRHAGVTAHLARELGVPVDLVMSYGGGPNVRRSLMSRGIDALRQKRLVIWMFAARDLHDYWEDWAPLEEQAGGAPR